MNKLEQLRRIIVNTPAYTQAATRDLVKAAELCDELIREAERAELNSVRAANRAGATPTARSRSVPVPK